MSEEDEHQARCSSNKYLAMSSDMRVRATRARSEEARGEYERIARLYERLANRASRGVYTQPDAPPLEPYKGVNRMPLEETYFHYDRASVTSHAPGVPGVYALWNRDVWVYVGETDDIKKRLLEHLSGENECIASGRPTAFGFELIDDPVERIARQAALIRDLLPIC